MSYVTNPVPASRPSLLWRFRFPLVVLVVCGCVIALPFIGRALAFPGEARMPLMMAAYLAAPGGALLILIWWLFFSGVRWLVRLGVLASLVLAYVGFYFSLHKAELTTRDDFLLPVFHFVWETTPEEKLAQHQAQPVTLVELPALDATVGSEDFPRFRGVRFDGIVAYLRLQTDWNTYPPEKLWELPCPGGYGGVAVAGNSAVTLQQRGNQEVIVCYDRASGRQRWAYPYKAEYRDKNKMGDGPRSTPTIHDGRVFTIGATGELYCVTTDGKYAWNINILDDSKATNMKWGLTGSPLIVDDLVIAHPGIDPDAPNEGSLLAFVQATGKKRWAVGKRRAGYSSPQLASIGGIQQVLVFDGEGLVSYEPKAGKELWNHSWVTMNDMNLMQPIVFPDGRVFISSEARPNGCAMLRVRPPAGNESGWKVETVWKNRNLGARFANPVTDGKSIFGLHDVAGLLRCLDASDGSEKWSGERMGPGQLLLVGETLLVVDDEAMVRLYKTDSAECEELARYEVFPGSRYKTWNTPALAGDQLFVRNQAEIACVRLPRR